MSMKMQRVAFVLGDDSSPPLRQLGGADQHEQRRREMPNNVTGRGLLIPASGLFFCNTTGGKLPIANKSPELLSKTGCRW